MNAIEAEAWRLCGVPEIENAFVRDVAVLGSIKLRAIL